MPIYEYHCPSNDAVVEVLHGSGEKVLNWGDICRLARISSSDTPADAPVIRLLSSPSLAFPKTNTELKNMGFTKLVRREKGVYENVTATGTDSRFMKADDPSSYPNFKKKISD